jgi:3-deoxy-manno-octulosonate cytidylyltransferase (CMP-KDO synthetase)
VMKVLAIIPARMDSSRYPGKPMVPILGVPMIGHIYQSVSQCSDVNMTVVATCDAVIFDYVTSIGGKAIMTSKSHQRASDRCAEALLKVEKETGVNFDCVVMIQGDEPMTKPEMVSQALRPFTIDSNIQVANLVATIASEQEFNDRNCIKVVCDQDNNAIYFSRSPIPNSSHSDEGAARKKQVCVIPFRRDFLITFNALQATPLEVAESIDMLRVIEHGFKVHMVPTEYLSFAVDTPEDRDRVEKLMGMA